MPSTADHPGANSNPRRRWLRFSLRSLFIVVTLIAAWLGWNVHQVRQRDELLREIERQGGDVDVPVDSANNDWSHAFRRLMGKSERELPLAWRVLGARPVLWIDLPQGFDGEMERVEQCFPEAMVLPYLPPDEPFGYPDAERWAELTSRRERFATPEPTYHFRDSLPSLLTAVALLAVAFTLGAPYLTRWFGNWKRHSP